MTSIHTLLISDYLLAALIPLVLLTLSIHILGNPADLVSLILGSARSPAGTTPLYFSVQRAAASYAQYARLARGELATMRASYGRMRWAHRRTGYALGYPRKLTRAEDAIAVNAVVADAVARLARAQFPEEVAGEGVFRPRVVGDLSRVREAMKHFVRDWSAEGERERERIFRPILDVLQDVAPEDREQARVLVPGAGLGRLAWEISRLGEW